MIRTGRIGRRGFTVVEFLVVLAIIGILIAAIIPLVGWVRSSITSDTPNLQYGDRVRVTDGFYKGQEGEVVQDCGLGIYKVQLQTGPVAEVGIRGGLLEVINPVDLDSMLDAETTDFEREN